LTTSELCCGARDFTDKNWAVELENFPRGIAAYMSHFEEIRDRHWGARVDQHHINSGIAAKMSMTGYTQSEIEQILV
jgi:hypothetical protein